MQSVKLSFINLKFLFICPACIYSRLSKFKRTADLGGAPNLHVIRWSQSITIHWSHPPFNSVCIEDSYISTGDHLGAVKSGWDEYGIAYGRPSTNITIRCITGSSPCAGIPVGTETSGGSKNILAEHVALYNMGIGIHINTNIGRGGIIQNITVSDVYMESFRMGIMIAGDEGDHPDDKFKPNAITWPCSELKFV